MSRSLNKVMLIGNLGADPEIRTTTGGSRMAQFSLATSRSWTTRAGEKQEKTEWHKIIVWNNNDSGGLVDVVEKYLKKGDRVYVEGRIEYRSYEDKEGQTRYVTEINVRELVMLTGRGDGNTSESGSSGRRSAAPAAAAPAAAGKREASAGKDESFDDFPEALDEEDDDLPF